MICYRPHMGPQTCAVGGVISQTTKQYIHPSGKKSDLDYIVPSSSNTIYINNPELSLASYLRTFYGPTIPSYLSITINRSTPSPEKPSSSNTQPHPHAQDSGQPIDHFGNWTLSNFPRYQPNLPRINANHDVQDHKKTILERTTETTQEPPSKIPKRLYHRHSCSLPCCNPVLSNFHRNTNNTFTITDTIQESNKEKKGKNLSKDPRKVCMSLGTHMMNEGEATDLWKRDDVSDAKSKSSPEEPESVPGDEPESVSSSGSLHASDNSEEDQFPHGVHVAHPTSQQTESKQSAPTTTEVGEPSTFLFIGPVGKKRRRCRERQASEEELDARISLSVPATPTGFDMSGDQDCASLVEGTDSSRGSGSAKSNGEVCEEPQITSTPTSVIRSAPKKRGHDQPLNLSLDPPHSIPSPGQRDHERVSVINLVPRGRLDEPPTSCPESYTSRSPTLGFPQSPSPRHSSEEEGSRLSPTPSTSDFFAISSGSMLSATSPSGPSSFQGLLAAHGIVPPSLGESGSSAQKKKLRCRDCGKEFSQLRNYKYHRSRHEGTQQFACTCPVCGKTFNDKGYLSSHLKIHRNEKEYKCEWCGKSFNQRVAYNMHIRIHTGHKPHKCSYCPKAFSRKMLLRQHIRTHTGERPYKCVVCGKAFADRSNMLLHQRLHSGERPYKCHICGKSFSKNHHLKTHLNHHAGIKPYQCQKCKACFSQSSNMKTHFRKCTGLPCANVTSTVTSGTLEPSIALPGPSPRNSTSTSAAPLVSNSLQTYTVTDAVEALRHEEQLQQQRRIREAQHEQLLSLSPSQQLLHEVTSMNLHNPTHGSNSSTAIQLPSPMLSPSRTGYRSTSTLSQHSLSHQSLGFNMSSMSVTSPPGMSRSRRPSGLSLIPLGNPSPTSLAAGHPFIPLTSLDHVGLSSGQSIHSQHLPSSIPSPSSLLLMSPRHHSTLGDLSPTELSQLQSFSQSVTTQQRTLTSRSRLLQESYMSTHQQTLETGSMDESRPHSQQTSVPRVSPNRQLSPRQSHPQVPQVQDYYDVILPALAISRGMPMTMSPRSQQIRTELLSEQQQLTRPQDLQRVFRIQNPNSFLNMNRPLENQGLLAVSGDSTSGSMGPLPSMASLASLHSPEGFRNSMPSFYEQRTRPQSWRAREGGNTKASYKDYRNSNT